MQQTTRYFFEVAYLGGRYAGSQVQANALTVQAELEKALAIYFRKPVPLTGASRTDAGVHALQNYYHADMDVPVPDRAIYNLNAILPGDIALQAIQPVGAAAHCRFDAVAREYEYRIYRSKDPFLQDRAYYYPYTLDYDRLQEAAGLISAYTDFTSFAKRNAQVHTHECCILHSEWEPWGEGYLFRVKANRFLRGMVRGLTGTMLQAGRGKLSLVGLKAVIEAKDCTRADFSVPGHGLYLVKVEYPDGYFGR